jgi:hypothetical protein
VWFDAFKVLKLVHYMRDNAFDNSELTATCQSLLAEIGAISSSGYSNQELLNQFRIIEQKKGL